MSRAFKIQPRCLEEGLEDYGPDNFVRKCRLKSRSIASYLILGFYGNDYN